MNRWRGVIEEYRKFLPVTERTPVITLGEGNTPLIRASQAGEDNRARHRSLFEIRRGQSHRLVQRPRDDHGDFKGR